MDRNKRICARIDLDAIVNNMEEIRAKIGENTLVTAVIKADGYGHGCVRIASKLEKLPYLWGFATATFEEALELRNAGITKPVMILGYVFPYCYEQLAVLDIRPALFRRDMMLQLNEAAKRTGRKIRVHIAVDTGMNRIGIRPDETGLAFVKEAAGMEGLEVEGIFTHFARADEENGKEATDTQYARFSDLLSKIWDAGIRIPLCHCSNSAAIMSDKDFDLNMVRAGIILYGLLPSREVDPLALKLRPALSLYSHIVYVKDIGPGDAVSYGGTYVADKKMRVATVPAGYGDGYPRSLSSKGYVLIRGQRAPIIGRICMDQFMVDVSGIPGAEEGDLVTLIGKDGNECITAEDLGDLSGRFNYELVCDINQRVPRVYTEEAEQ